MQIYESSSCPSLTKCNFFSSELPWLMEEEIIVQHKWIKGKQCMSTQVSFKQWRSTLHLVTNAQAPYLLEGYVPALIICKWQSWGVKEGHRHCRGHMEDEPCRGEELGVIFCSLCRGLAKALHLCQTLPFCFNYPISMIQVYVRALRGWSFPPEMQCTVVTVCYPILVA